MNPLALEYAAPQRTLQLLREADLARRAAEAPARVVPRPPSLASTVLARLRFRTASAAETPRCATC